jgi:hypothetical protein
MEIHVIHLTTNRIVKINIYFIYRFFRKFFQTELKLNICNLNPKIHIRSCVFIDNEPRKKNYSFVSIIDNYSMSEVSNWGLAKCKKKIQSKKDHYVKNVYFKEHYWRLNLLRGLP